MKYVRSTQGDGIAFVAMWSYWVSVWVTNAALAVGVVGYLTAVLPALGGLPPVLIAVGLIWLFVVVNLLGVRTGGRVQVVTTVLKLVPMAVIIGLGLWTLFVVSERLHSEPAHNTGDDALLRRRPLRSCRTQCSGSNRWWFRRPGARSATRHLSRGYDRGNIFITAWST